MVNIIANGLRPSAIAQLSQLAQTMPQVMNLGEGFPNFPLHPVLAEALIKSASLPVHQHTHGAGLPQLRAWIAERLSGVMPLNPDTQITITCGATQALMATMTTLLNPGDEVVVLEPFYEPYLNMIRLVGAIPRLVRLHAPDWTWQPQALIAAFTPKTRLVLLNTPHNPTGRVFTLAQCDQITQLANKYGAWVVVDAAYMDFTQAGMVWPAPSEKTIIIGSFSKSLRVTGWRLGYVTAPATVTAIIRQVHELQTCEAPVPLQHAVLSALTHYPAIIEGLFEQFNPYRQALTTLLNTLDATLFAPEGAVYVWACLPHWGQTPADAAKNLLTQKNMLAIPADSFYDSPPHQPWLRWCYLKSALLNIK